jgi:hypothetical protein
MNHLDELSPYLSGERAKEKEMKGNETGDADIKARRRSRSPAQQ